MITSLFRKSTPLNYSIVIIGVVFFFFVFQIKHSVNSGSLEYYGLLLLQLSFILGSVFITNFIVKKNGLSKNSAYTVLFYLIFLQFFPTILDDTRIILSNFFILLALRRIISMHSVKSHKEKIFDSAMWIFVATLFHFWAILFIILVFISILFHGARDYRNWFLPIIAIFTVATIALFFSLILNQPWIYHLIGNAHVDFKFGYFKSVAENLSLSIYATIGLFFMVSLLMSLSNRPLILHSSYKKMMSAFLIGILILIVSPLKSNNLMLFTFAPLAMMATSHIEMSEIKWQKELILGILIVGGIILFFSQL